MRFEILTIGDELLNGDLADTNTQRFGRLLRQRGLVVSAAQSVPDRLEAIVGALRLAARSEVVLVSGGLGPTSDDLTLEAAASYAGVALETHTPTVERLVARYSQRGVTMTPNNLRQAQVPGGAEVFDNPVGTAPHVQLQVGATRYFFFPGVPGELQRLCVDYLVPWLEAHAPVRRYQSWMFRTFGKTESAVAALLDPVLGPGAERAPGLHVAYRAHFPEIQVSLHVQGEEAAAGARLTEAAAIVRERLGEIIFSERADQGMVEVVADALVERGETLALAESCTGGMIAAMCTEVPGASRWLLEGFVTYANAAKVGRLGVEPALLEAHGAVSEEVARAMAEGARRVSGATWGLAVTGIAGPGGGTADKPVGTVHLALAGPNGTQHLARVFPFDRERNRRVTAQAALELLRRSLRRS